MSIAPFSYYINRFQLLDWMVFILGAGLGTLAWEGSWFQWGWFLVDLLGAAASGIGGGVVLWLILQAWRDA